MLAIVTCMGKSDLPTHANVSSHAYITHTNTLTYAYTLVLFQFSVLELK